MNFKTLAAQLKMSEEDEAAFLAVTGKYPLDSVLVPKVDFAKIQSDFEAADLKVKEWESWKGNNWDAEHGMTTQQWAALQEAETLRGKVASIESGTYVPTGDNMDFADVEKELVQKGYLTKDTATGLLTAVKTELQTTIDQKLNAQNLGQEFFFTRASVIPMKFRDEFGSIEGFDMDAFMRHVMSGDGRFLKDPADPTGKTMVRNFDAAYNEFVGPKRMELKQAALDKQAADLKVREESLNTRQTTTAVSPTDDGRGGAPPPFQRQIQGLDKDDIKLGGDAPFGSGQVSAQAWQLYQKGELPGVGSKPN